MDYTIYHPSLMSFRKRQDMGTNAENVRNNNRRLILQLIQDTGIISRQTLTKRTGLQLATITIAINDLLDMGVIKEVGLIEGEHGRRIMGFSINHDNYCVVSIRMSPSYLKIGCYDLNNENLYIKKIFIETLKDIQHTCNIIENELNEIAAMINDRTVIGLGLGVEGPFIIHGGYYKFLDPKSPNGYFDIGQVLFEKLGYPIIVNKATNFGVYHQWKANSSQTPLGTYVYVTISYAIECGIIVNGEIINGANGYAGNIGNVTTGFSNSLYEVASLESQASTTYVIKRVLDLLSNYPDSILTIKKNDLNIRDVIKAFTLEDPLAFSVFNEVGIRIGRVIADLINILNPEFIKLGDEIPQTAKMKRIIEDEARSHIPHEVDLNLHFDVLDFDASRNTRLDPALLGASSYVVDAYIQSMDFTE